MNDTNIKILSGEDAAKVMDGHDDLVRSFIEQFPKTELIAQEMLKKDPTDTGARERVIKERCDNAWERIRGNLASVILQKDQIVGMAYHHEIGEWKGRRVHEVGGSVVLPEFRGASFSTRLAEQCMQEVFASDPDALCLGLSTNKGIQQRYARWVEDGFAEYMDPVDYQIMTQEFENGGIAMPRDKIVEIFLPGYATTKIILIDLKKWKAQRT